MASAGRCDGVMIVGFGGPTRAEEIRPFLDNVLRGRPVPRERYEEVVRHYEALGGRSPYNDITMRQAAARRERLQSDAIAMPVEVGMRNWEPYVVDAMVALERAGVRRALCFIMSAFRCEASWSVIRRRCARRGRRSDRARPKLSIPSHGMRIRDSSPQSPIA